MNQNTIANGRDANGRDGNGLAALLETIHRHNLALIDLVGQWSDYRAGKRDMPETDLATALTPASSNDNAANTVLGKIVKSALRCGYGNIPKTHWLDDARMSTRKLIKAIAALHGTDFIPDMRQHADAFYALLEDTARDDVTLKQFKKELEDRVWFFVKACTKNANELDKFLLNVQPVPHEQNLVADVIPLLDALPDAVRDGRITGEDLLRLKKAVRRALDAFPPNTDNGEHNGKSTFAGRDAGAIKISKDGQSIDIDGRVFRFTGLKQWQFIDKLFDAFINNRQKTEVGDHADVVKTFGSPKGQEFLLFVTFEKLKGKGNKKYTGYAKFKIDKN